VQEIWNRIESWLEANEPETFRDLLPGATDEEIHSAEELMDVRFPEDATESYKVHNGQGGNGPPLLWGEWHLLSLEDITQQWELMKDLYHAGEFMDAQGSSEGPVRAEWWNPKWIPVAYNGAGDLQCLDIDPAAGGNSGQIIAFWHMNPEREVITDSFRAWLEVFANSLEGSR